MTIVADTSFVTALHSSFDENHERAKELAARAKAGEFGQLLLPEYVFDEAVTLALSRAGHHRALELGAWLLSSEFELVYSEPDVFEEAWRLFSKSTRLSFTDCFVACLARKRGASVLTFDTNLTNFLGVRAVR